MSSADRVSLAKERTSKVVRHLRAVIEMHEANAIVVYSPTLADQIPKSHAAHAFNQFQNSMLFFEIVRLCALWDGVDRHKENIPTIIELIDDNDVQGALAEETREHLLGLGPPRLYDVAANQEIKVTLDRLSHRFADQQAAKTLECLADATAKARSVTTSPRLQSVLNMRHKHLAHSLSATHLERKEYVTTMRCGDESWLLEETIAVVDGLSVGINGAAFPWEEARLNARRNAKALWNFCTFKVDD